MRRGVPGTRRPRPSRSQGTPPKLDEGYPAYTVGRAADLLGVQPAFLPRLDAAGLLTSNRSAGGQCRYSGAELTSHAGCRPPTSASSTLRASKIPDKATTQW